MPGENAFVINGMMTEIGLQSHAVWNGILPLAHAILLYAHAVHYHNPLLQRRRATGIICGKFSVFSIENVRTYVMTPHQNRLTETVLMRGHNTYGHQNLLKETVLMRGHNILLYCKIRKIIFELSSIPFLICSTDTH